MNIPPLFSTKGADNGSFEIVLYFTIRVNTKPLTLGRIQLGVTVAAASQVRDLVTPRNQPRSLSD